MNASRLPIYFIVATVAIDAMGIGLIMPVMPDLLRDVHGGDLSGAAIWGGVLATTFAAMQFVFGADHWFSFGSLRADCDEKLFLDRSTGC